MIFLISTIAYSSTITGFAPEFIGEKVVMYTYSDYITMTRVEIGNAIVSDKDSTFQIEFDTKQTIKGMIEVGNTEAEIYLSPETDYNIFYKKKEDTPMAFARQKASTFFSDLDSSDINYKVLAYENWFDEYLYVHQKDIIKHGLGPYIDTFKQYAYAAYANEKNTYFVNYVRYDIAMLERTKRRSASNKLKYVEFLEYIKPFPVYPYNDKYMEFIKSYYSADLSSLHTQFQAEIILAIDNGSPTRLMTVMYRDPLYENDELRQLMMINMLGNGYYKRQYDRSNIRTILDSVSRFSKYRENSIAAKNILKYLTKIEAGYPAPDISLMDNHDDLITFGKYKGKFIYINFFTTWNNDAVKEMKLMEELYYNYSDYVEFISFCMDKDSTSYKTFLEENKALTWPIIYVGENHQVIKDFNVVSSPHYFLLDQDGFISMAPAKSPAPDGVYETVEKTFRYIRSRLRE